MKLLRRMKRVWRKLNSFLKQADLDKSSRFAVLWDIVYCKLFLRCTLEEYFSYELYCYKNYYRKYFIFENRKRKIYRKINPRYYSKHKWECHKKISRGIKREMMLISECGEQAFVEFLKKHKKIITKPDVGSLGRDVRVFEYTTGEDAVAYFKTLPEATLCEEYIKQHEKMSSLNPSSVNSLRICTLCEKGKVTFISATLKSGGAANAIVDNLHHCGIGAMVDLETGVVLGCGHDFQGNRYVYHPVTGTQIVGFTVPYWSETLELIRKTHLDIAECPFIGWDVAVAEYGPEIIEINSAPGPRNMQMMDQKPKGKILWDYIKRHKK